MVTVTCYAATGKVLPLPLVPESVSFSAVWQGGDESAEIQATLPASIASPWLDHLQAGVVICDRGGRRVWRGYIESVEIDDGVTRAAQSLDGMANEVRVQYTNRWGIASVTSAAQDTASVARYQRHQALVAAGEMDSTEADFRRDTYLRRAAWPSYESGASLRTGVRPGLASVTLRCRGWWAWMYKCLFIQPTVGSLVSVQTQTVLAGLINTALGDNTYGVNGFGTFENQAFTGPYTNARLRTGSAVYSLPVTDTTVWRVAGTMFEEIAARGDENGEPVSYMMQPELTDTGAGVEIPVVRMRTWAGATPDTITYTLAGGTILGPGMTPMLWPQVRPNAMVRRTTHPETVPPAGAVDTMGRFFLARTTYRWQRGQGESLDLEPVGGGSAALLLSRVR